MTVEREWKNGRARVVTPGKHGPNDYRSEIRGIAPTLGEFALMLGGKLMAEDRYNRPSLQSRHLYLGYLREVAQASDMDEVAAIAERANIATSFGGLPGFVHCHRGGKNECVSLCPECFAAGFRLPDAVVRSNLQWWGCVTSEEEIEHLVGKVRNRTR